MRAFTIHEQSGLANLFGFLEGVGVTAAGLVHLVVARWTATAAWVLTGTSICGAIWLTAVARCFATLSVVVAGGELTLRAGILWMVRLPVGSVRLKAPGGPRDGERHVWTHAAGVVGRAASGRYGCVPGSGSVGQKA